MADFRQLALEFVLEDDENKLTGLAKKTATGLSHMKLILIMIYNMF